MKNVNIYSDGACSGNPGPGGFGVILEYNGRERELSGGEKDTTNNRMELMGIIVGLESLMEPCCVTVTADSKYVVDSFNKGWLASWQKNNWKKSDGKQVLNIDLWQRLIAVKDRHTVKFVHILGHNGHEMNERCDQIAVSQRDKYKKMV